MYSEYKRRVKDLGLSEARNYAPSAYDAMIAVSLALHKADQYLQRNSSKTLANFTYEDASMAQLYVSILQTNVTFRGMTVSMQSLQGDTVLSVILKIYFISGIGEFQW